MSWIIDALKKCIGSKASYGVAMLIIGIIATLSLPKFFVTHPILAGEVSSLRRADLSTDMKMLEFQKSQLIQRKWDLEDAIDRQNENPTTRQMGRLNELVAELQTLQTKLSILERELKGCQ